MAADVSMASTASLSPVRNSDTSLTSDTASPALETPPFAKDLPLALRRAHRSNAGLRKEPYILVPEKFETSIKDLKITLKRKLETPNSKSEKKKTVREKEDYVPSSRKKKKIPKNVREQQDSSNDFYCWVCHREGSMICCDLCPRVYHSRCLQLSEDPDGDWFCPECQKIMKAECVESQSRAMAMLSVDQLSRLLIFSLQRMKHTWAQPFMKPVDAVDIPDYYEYIFHPMDLSTLEKNIKSKKYGSTDAFLADAKWIMHNCIVYNGSNHKFTNYAKMIIKICKHEMSEIEICEDCYLSSCIKRDNWFCEPCKEPHPLVWARLQGFPFWPAKALQTKKGQVDVRFFGQHDRAWVPLSNCYKVSKEIPCAAKKKTNGLNSAISEMTLHIEKIRKKFGDFEYAPHRTPYDPKNTKLRNYNPVKPPPKTSKVSNSIFRKAPILSIKKEPLDESDKLIIVDEEVSLKVSTNSVQQSTCDSKETEKLNKTLTNTGNAKESLKKSDNNKSTGIQNNAEINDNSSSRKVGKTDAPKVNNTESLKSQDSHTSDTSKEDVKVKDSNKEESEIQSNSTDAKNIGDIKKKNSGEKDSEKTSSTLKGTSNEYVEPSHDKSILEKIVDSVKDEMKEKEQSTDSSPKAMSIAKDDTKVAKESDVEKLNGIQGNSENIASTTEENKKSENSTDTENISKDIGNENINNKEMKDVRETEKCSEKIDNKTAVMDDTEHTDTINETSEDDDKLIIDENDEEMKKIFDENTNVKNSSEGILEDESRKEDVKMEEDSSKEKTDTEEIEDHSKPNIDIEVMEDFNEKKTNTKEIDIADKNEQKDSNKQITDTEEMESSTNEKMDNIEDLNSEKNNKETKDGKRNTFMEKLGKTIESCKAILGLDSEVDDKDVEMQSESESEESDSESESSDEDIEEIGYEVRRKRSCSSEEAMDVDDERTGKISPTTEGVTNDDKHKSVTVESNDYDKPESGKADTKDLEDGDGKEPIQNGIDGMEVEDADISHNTVVDAKQGEANLEADVNQSNKSKINNADLKIELNDKKENEHLENDDVFDHVKEIVDLSHQKAPENKLDAACSEIEESNTKKNDKDKQQTDKESDTDMKYGPMAASIRNFDKYIGKVSDVVKEMLIEMYSEVTEASVEDETKKLMRGYKEELDFLKWRHTRELEEFKHVAALTIAEMRSTFDHDKSKALEALKAKMETEKQTAIEQTKKKQWCANCVKEAVFYCCWNTSYCDYPCQQKHWPVHMKTCQQLGSSENTEKSPKPIVANQSSMIKQAIHHPHGSDPMLQNPQQLPNRPHPVQIIPATSSQNKLQTLIQYVQAPIGTTLQSTPMQGGNPRLPSPNPSGLYRLEPVQQIPVLRPQNILRNMVGGPRGQPVILRPPGNMLHHLPNVNQRM